MKIYLDDERTTPEGFVRTFTPTETIDLLSNHEGSISLLSLDHDLGDDEGIGTGYDVVLWIEEQVVENGYTAPDNIVVHSANSSARVKMQAGIDQIYELTRRGNIVDLEEAYEGSVTAIVKLSDEHVEIGVRDGDNVSHRLIANAKTYQPIKEVE